MESMMLLLTFLPFFSSLLLVVELLTSCPEHCTCPNVGVVRCTSPSDRLVEVPSPLPEGTLELSIVGQDIEQIRKGDFTDIDRPAVNLSIVRSGLRAIEYGAFENLTNLLHLNLQENEILEVRWETFDGLDRLFSLQMHGNVGLVIQPCALGALFYLRRLALAFAPFSYEFFRSSNCILPDSYIYRRLEYLSMATTGLSGVELYPLYSVHELNIREKNGAAFFDLDVSSINALRILHLRDLVVIPADLRHDQLLEVHIDHPLFTHLPANAFNNTPFLATCAITGGSLTHIHKDAFKGLTILQSVDFSMNRIRTLPSGLFEGVSLPINSLLLDNNPLSCNCSIAWLLDGSTSLSVNGVCDSPENVAGAPLHQIAFSDSTSCNGNEGDVTPVVQITEDPRPPGSHGNAATESSLPVTLFRPTQDAMSNPKTAYISLGVSVALTVVLIVGFVILCGLWLKQGKDIRDLKIVIECLSTGQQEAEHIAFMHAATSGRREVVSDSDNTGTRPNRVLYARNIVETGAPVDTHQTNVDISHSYYMAELPRQ